MISNPLFIAVGLQILQNSKRIFSFIKPMLAKNLWITALFGQKNLWITAIFEEKNLWITTKTLIFAPIFNKLDPS
jgi:hypothetical protein